MQGSLQENAVSVKISLIFAPKLSQMRGNETVRNAEVVFLRNCFLHETKGREQLKFSALFKCFCRKNNKYNLKGTKQFCKQVFHTIDVRKKGSLDFESFVHVCQILLMGSLETRLEGEQSQHCTCISKIIILFYASCVLLVL